MYLTPWKAFFPSPSNLPNDGDASTETLSNHQSTNPCFQTKYGGQNLSLQKNCFESKRENVNPTNVSIEQLDYKTTNLYQLTHH
jgi:hypothetical protein